MTAHRTPVIQLKPNPSSHHREAKTQGPKFDSEKGSTIPLPAHRMMTWARPLITPTHIRRVKADICPFTICKLTWKEKLDPIKGTQVDLIIAFQAM